MKRVSCERDKKLSHMENTVHLESPRVVGGWVLRGTCHMLSESGLKQKPSKSKQDRQPDPPWNGGGEIQWTVCVCVCVHTGRQAGRQASVFLNEMSLWQPFGGGG